MRRISRRHRGAPYPRGRGGRAREAQVMNSRALPPTAKRRPTTMIGGGVAQRLDPVHAPFMVAALRVQEHGRDHPRQRPPRSPACCATETTARPRVSRSPRCTGKGRDHPLPCPGTGGMEDAVQEGQAASGSSRGAVALELGSDRKLPDRTRPAWRTPIPRWPPTWSPARSGTLAAERRALRHGAGSCSAAEQQNRQFERSPKYCSILSVVRPGPRFFMTFFNRESVCWRIARPSSGWRVS